MAEQSERTTSAGGGSLSERLPELNRKNVAAAVGMAAAVVAGAVAVRAYRRKGASGGPEAIFHLRQDGEDWLLELEGSGSPQGTFATKQEGLEAARTLARESAPCELVIYRGDGSVQDRHAYGA